MPLQVAPYEIFRIDKHEGSTATPVSYEANVEELTQEMIVSQPSDKKGKVRAITSLCLISMYIHMCIMFMLV